jgi:hypothetical protein
MSKYQILNDKFNFILPTPLVFGSEPESVTWPESVK